MTAIVVLGMHRSGTSCLAGMLAAGGLGATGEAVRNWDNARGHHEMLDLVRLNEAVLAHSHGHWLSPPPAVRWTDEQAADRDRLLAMQVEGRPALLKDPRTLLVLPFWRASTVPFHAIGIVRHPVAVARSFEAWRELPLADGIALWTAHNRVLVEERSRVIDFDAPQRTFIEAVLAACRAFGPFDADALAAAYEDQLVHHDGGEVPVLAGIDEALALHRRLVERSTDAVPQPLVDHETEPLVLPASEADTATSDTPRAGASETAAFGGTSERRFPRARLAAFARALDEGRVADAIEEVRAALASVTDGSAVLVPVVTALIRRHTLVEAIALIEEQAARLEVDLASLLVGKILLAKHDAVAAVPYLERACAVAKPYFQARPLLAQALRGAQRTIEAREVLAVVTQEALYPHGPLSTLAEWSWLDGDRAAALAEMAAAIEAAPPRRRGRLRTRRAEWLIEAHDLPAARAELERAIAEDPSYQRSRDVLAQLR
jgi:hypothetical protein